MIEVYNPTMHQKRMYPSLYLAAALSLVFLSVHLHSPSHVGCRKMAGKLLNKPRRTVGQNSKKSGCKYWANCWSVHSFARTAHSFAWSALLISLGTLLRSFVHSLPHSLPSSWESESLMSQNDLILPHSAAGSVVNNLCTFNDFTHRPN